MGTSSQTFEGADGTEKGSGDSEPTGIGLTSAEVPDQKGAEDVNDKPVGMKSRQSLDGTNPGFALSGAKRRESLKGVDVETSTRCTLAPKQMREHRLKGSMKTTEGRVRRLLTGAERLNEDVDRAAAMRHPSNRERSNSTPWQSIPGDGIGWTARGTESASPVAKNGRGG